MNSFVLEESRSTMTISLTELGLLDAPPEPSFDNLTALASQIIGTPVSLISILDIDADRQFFKSQIGLIDPWTTDRQTPLSHSFCRHVVKSNDALVVENALEHALVKDNLAIPDLGVIAYLGVPIYAPGNDPVGALCVIDGKPRAWNVDDIATLKRLSDCVSDAIRLNASIRTSERLRAEQRLFTYAFSHDLKAPANSLRLILQEIDEDPLIGDDSRSLLSNGSILAERMAQQVTDVLDYTRVVDAAPSFTDVDLNTLLDAVVANLDAVIKEKAAALFIDTLPVVPGSESQLTSLFQNLLGNALIYTDRDSRPEVNIEAIATDREYNISVRDNGIGISEEHQKQIFELFARLHPREDYPGTGIGLTICQRVAENHNGSISLSSTPGKGSTFTVHLPKAAM
ncbi:MAG: ATP-binding protein [Pseudomonadota bacterium]